MGKCLLNRLSINTNNSIFFGLPNDWMAVKAALTLLPEYKTSSIMTTFLSSIKKFISVEVAARFSYETSVPENQGLTPFGFHFNLPPTISIEE